MEKRRDKRGFKRRRLDKMSEDIITKAQRFDYYDEDFYDNGRLMGNDEVLVALNQADNKIDKLQKRSRRLFLLEKVISQMLPIEKQEELYNRLHLELIQDEHD